MVGLIAATTLALAAASSVAGPTVLHVAEERFPLRIFMDGEERWIWAIHDYGWSSIEVTEEPNPAEERETWYVFESKDDAGAQARKQWEDKDDRDLVSSLGLNSLISMASGTSVYIDRLGTVENLPKLFEYIEECPEFVFSSQHGEEASIEEWYDEDDEEGKPNLAAALGLDDWSYLAEEIGFEPTIAYRSDG